MVILNKGTGYHHKSGIFLTNWYIVDNDSREVPGMHFSATIYYLDLFAMIYIWGQQLALGNTESNFYLLVLQTAGWGKIGVIKNLYLYNIDDEYMFI